MNIRSKFQGNTMIYILKNLVLNSGIENVFSSSQLNRYVMEDFVMLFRIEVHYFETQEKPHGSSYKETKNYLKQTSSYLLLGSKLSQLTLLRSVIFQ